jgi:ankyrin repeat protein
VVQTLLQQGADVAATDQDEETSLHKASYHGHAAVVQTLLENGADVAATNKDGRTSLHRTSMSGYAAVVQTLLQHGADVAARDRAGKTPLDVAEYCDDEVKKEEVKTALREHRAQHSLFYVAQKGMVALVADLIKEGADVNEKNHDEETSLHKASYHGHAAVVQTLLENGADVAATTKDGRTSLHRASLSGYAAVVQTLLQHGADVAARDGWGKTPLDYLEDCDDEVKKEEVKAVFVRHSLLLAAQVGALGLLLCHRKMGYPSEGTRQTVCERLNDVWVRGRLGPQRVYIKIKLYSEIGSSRFCQSSS